MLKRAALPAEMNLRGITPIAGVARMGRSKKGDRRKYQRIATDQVISFAPVETRDLLGVSRNLSMGGIRFEAVGCEIDLGDTLRVTFNVARFARACVSLGRLGQRKRVRDVPNYGGRIHTGGGQVRSVGTKGHICNEGWMTGPGVYFVRIKAGDFSATEKMLLMR